MAITRNDYYGKDTIDSISFLEFGSIDIKSAKKTIWAYRQDQDAYDLYMFSRYASDLFAFRDGWENKEGGVTALNHIVLNSAHTKLMDYLFKYAGLLTAVEFGAKAPVCESGSSLYGWIDEAIAFDKVLFEGEHVSEIKSLKYLCSDISDLMNKGAQAFHPDIAMSTSLSPTIDALMQETKQLSLFYGLGVSMRYALRSALDMKDLAKKSQLAIFNRLSVFKGEETLQTVYGSGKNAYVISLSELIKVLEDNGVVAKYCTSNLQKEKDGKNTLRASIVMSTDGGKLNTFIKNYDSCVVKCLEVEGVTKGEWKKLCCLVEE